PSNGPGSICQLFGSRHLGPGLGDEIVDRQGQWPITPHFDRGSVIPGGMEHGSLAPEAPHRGLRDDLVCPTKRPESTAHLWGAPQQPRPGQVDVPGHHVQAGWHHWQPRAPAIQATTELEKVPGDAAAALLDEDLEVVEDPVCHATVTAPVGVSLETARS